MEPAMRISAAHEALTLGEARDRYLADNGFGDGGYEARWVTLMAGPLPIRLPNTAARVRAVRLHDLHHPLTGYDTTWTGEAEIGAWEIASSCAGHAAAWVLNLAAIAIGVAIAPVRTFRAFVRGRHSANLYRTSFDDALLARPFAEVRSELALDRAWPGGTIADGLAFAAWCALGALLLALSVAPLALLGAGAVATLRWAIG